MLLAFLVMGEDERSGEPLEDSVEQMFKTMSLCKQWNCFLYLFNHFRTLQSSVNPNLNY